MASFTAMSEDEAVSPRTRMYSAGPKKRHLTANFRDGVRQVESHIETLTLIGEGSVPNTKIVGRFQFVANANGETTVEIDQTDTICL